jgi:hypothetical protein
MQDVFHVEGPSPMHPGGGAFPHQHQQYIELDPEVRRRHEERVDRLIEEALDDRQTFLQVMAGRCGVCSRACFAHLLCMDGSTGRRGGGGLQGC